MGHVSRKSFAAGWCPDCDAVNAPPDALLRADNLVLDELGVVALRPGSNPIGAPLSDLDVHSLFTTDISGVRYRMAGAGNSVYANGAVIQSALAGVYDVAFGFQLGEILFARSTTKKKFDGTTVRNWGIAMTGAKPTVTAIAADKKVFATCAQGETPAFLTVEDDGTGPTYAADHNAVINTFFVSNPTGALVFHPAANGHASYQKTFLSPVDFSVYDGGQEGTDDDIITWYLAISNPSKFISATVQIDVNDGTFLNDFYGSPPQDGQPPHDQVGPNPGAPIVDRSDRSPAGRLQIIEELKAQQEWNRVGAPQGAGSAITYAAAWNKISVRRGDFIRIGATAGKDWSTVKSVRFHIVVTDPTIQVRVDTLMISGGSERTLTGSAQWRYIYVRNDGKYLALSAPSDASDLAIFNVQAAAVTIPADTGRDSQVNEIWLYREDQKLDTYYRINVKTGVANTGPYFVNDYVSDTDALTIDLPLRTDLRTPPDNIIGIVGPHFDRTLVLTSDGELWPSQKLDPDAFATGQIISVCGRDETPLWIFQALNNVFIGSTKDIYRLEGTGGELPDGSVDYLLQPLKIDHPPINNGVAHEGTHLVYCSDNGWRATSGSGSELLVGATSWLYRGKARHGVSAVNLASGRFRAVMGHGQLLAITPEGLATDRSPVVYRYVFPMQRWYRHLYVASGNWRSITREPDGTLIAGDDAGTIWELDSGTQDGGENIPFTLWTKVDDLELPYQRKKAGDLRWRSDTGGVATSVAVHLDNSASASTTLTATQAGMSVDAFDLADAISIFRHIQFRVTGTVPAFHLYDYGIQYRERPVPIIGRVVETLSGSPGVKILSGFVLKCNTLGEARIVTPVLDGVATSQTFTITTGTEEPETLTLRFFAAHRATDVAIKVDGELEIDSWSAIVTQRQPLGVLVWDSGPIDLGEKELVWLREMHLKVRAEADLVITPWFDGTAYPTVTAKVTADTDTVIRVPVGRAYVGRQPRLVVTSCAPFYPYWCKAIRRTSGQGTGKPSITVPFTLETGQ